MKRIFVVAITVIALAIGTWIGWPREGGPVDPTAQESSGAVAPGGQDDFDDPEGTSDETADDAAATEAVDGRPDAGDPAVEVTAEPEFDETAPTEPVEATWDDTVRKAARDAALATITAFAATDKAEDAWWAGLQPLLTPQARPVYQDVDPRLVPVTEVTGDPEVTDETSTLLAEVAVPTDIGPYTVLLTRADGAAPWLAEQIRPPEGS
ncbi:hypothetical protein C8K30_103197 [Promicromonospora sp. AC04]|uniref:hypothetical protein n=1 Tax=Promicromonospora sp. AC04 TaxID=2135723 RepID=UPI000D3CBC88|nr:hypothetical protein [Promicromonospora sp. AC04]PUB28776.1 hypothetical protein C8K30_103197 [Promicromonospora sp. AC04]